MIYYATPSEFLLFFLIFTIKIPPLRGFEFLASFYFSNSDPINLRKVKCALIAVIPLVLEFVNLRAIDIFLCIVIPADAGIQFQCG